MRAEQPILVFDTGVGGLSVLEPIQALLPNAPIVYAMDRAGYPYGQKTEAELTARVPEVLSRLVEHTHARLACIACNTASTIALDMVRDVLKVPIVGTVPAIKPAAMSSLTGVIGMLGTRGTVRQRYVDRLEAEFVNDGTLLRFAAPDLVGEAENKLRGKPVNRAVVKASLEGLIEQDATLSLDRIVLGCTHFPLLTEELMDVAVFDLGLSPDIQFVDGATGIARRVAHLTDGQPWPKAPTAGTAISISDHSEPENVRTALRRYGIAHFETL